MNLGPETINQYANDLGPWLYAVLFLIIFAETGLVITPFLPGTHFCSRSAPSPPIPVLQSSLD